MPSEMTEPCCPYLVCEKTAFRASLDLSAAAPMNIVVTWYCRHPFHGMRLELGEHAAKWRGTAQPARFHGNRWTVAQT